MAAIFGSNLMSALRLLTPSEINRITGINTKRKANASGQVITDDESGLINTESSSTTGNFNQKTEGNVLQLKKEQQGPKEELDPYKETPKGAEGKILKIEQKAEKTEVGPNIKSQRPVAQDALAQSREQSNLEKLGVFSAEKIRSDEELKRRKEKDAEDSSTVFILKEKDKVKESQKKLKVKEVLDSYRANATMDIQRKSDDEDDLSISDNQGILLNKKQF